MSTSKQLIINADDFGLTPGVTAGILYAHQHGILTSTTAMINTAFAKAGLREAKCFPELGIGLHFVLDTGRPVSSSPRSLVDQNGCFLKGTELMIAAEKQDIKEELLAQLELLYEWNGMVTHNAYRQSPPYAPAYTCSHRSCNLKSPNVLNCRSVHFRIPIFPARRRPAIIFTIAFMERNMFPSTI